MFCWTEILISAAERRTHEACHWRGSGRPVCEPHPILMALPQPEALEAVCHRVDPTAYRNTPDTHSCGSSDTGERRVRGPRHRATLTWCLVRRCNNRGLPTAQDESDCLCFL